MLEQKYVDNLIKLRDWLLANRELVQSHLDFKCYIRGARSSDSGCFSHPEFESITPDFINTITPECSTTCCALGWAAVSNLFPHDSEDWDAYCYNTFGVDPFDLSTGEYLFGVRHPSDFDLMIDRFNYVITNRIAPESFIQSMKTMEN